MKTILAALNATYMHTNLAVRSVAAYCSLQGRGEVGIWERTINHHYTLLLNELAELPADVVIFSSYIWNIVLVRRLAADLAQIRPELLLLAAGPEVSFHTPTFLKENPAFSGVLPGEGEALTANLLRRLSTGEGVGKSDIQQLIDELIPLPWAELDAIPFPYPDLAELGNRILYYESMRGCPFRCAYCLSSISTGPVRFRDTALVFRDLKRFLRQQVGQVKFVDRTFNCNSRRAMEIFRWLRDNDNGVTRFHFEMAAELIDGEMCALLATLRPGQVQLEIGVQTTNPQTMEAIRRPGDPARLFWAVRELQKPGNIHLHLDLIAGLPLEGYASFARSFNEVYSLSPHQLQLGFLKVLKGSAMETDAARYGIRYQRGAPYEVLCTGSLSFREVFRLHGIADMVERYYNSGRFSALVAEIVRGFDTPFAFYEALSAYYTEQGHDAAPPSKTGYYEVLGGFLGKMGILMEERYQWLCRYDMALHEKMKKTPGWVEVDGSAPYRNRILAFFRCGQNVGRYLPHYVGKDPKYLIKVAHVEVFPFHPVTGEREETALLFDYAHRDLLGRAAVHRIDLPETAGPPVEKDVGL